MARLEGRDARQTEQSEGEAECSESMTGVRGWVLGTAKARSLVKFGWVGVAENDIDA